jgi:hypothetical protein
MDRWLDLGPWLVVARWWGAQGGATKLALAVAGVFTVASVLNVVQGSLGRTGTTAAVSPVAASLRPTAAPPALTLEAAPTDPAKTWSVTRVWQGTGNNDTEAFTVTEHWRVDWIFNPVKPGAILQIFIYRSDGGVLANLAANAQKSGSDTSFWAGAGTYFFKVKSSGGDWKISVQDLR